MNLRRPSTSLSSDIRRCSSARRCNEASIEESPLSMYSKSGLFMESQVDIVSSIETESPERPGDTKLLQGTKAGARLGTWTVVGTLGRLTLCFCLVLLSRRDTGGAGLMEADFTAEPRMELSLRTFAKDGFFKGAAEVAEFNFCMRFEQKGQVISNLCFGAPLIRYKEIMATVQSTYRHIISYFPEKIPKQTKTKDCHVPKTKGLFFCTEVCIFEHDEQNPSFQFNE